MFKNSIFQVGAAAFAFTTVPMESLSGFDKTRDDRILGAMSTTEFFLSRQIMTVKDAYKTGCPTFAINMLYGHLPSMSLSHILFV